MVNRVTRLELSGSVAHEYPFFVPSAESGEGRSLELSTYCWYFRARAEAGK